MKKKDNKNMLIGLAYITQVGLSIVTPIILGAYLGNWLDRKFHTDMIFSIVFIIIGTLAGFLNLFKLGPKNPDKKE
ncbi:AtpZ/AtpI family protein [Anaerosalibacter sp. Marseille-P3206]|uniref:AtpZ/AtpI family protein n=1 Tax=Anaerosalibacter sp. Marseille-P3206 TaxID=1871005 RepID=UPI00098525B1|nr:AtpZ/AtpI family protein [Anaerosalibacter sp. Marseille-P3206]